MSETTKCLWCMRKHKRDGDYCSDEHEAKAQVPSEYTKDGQARQTPKGGGKWK